MHRTIALTAALCLFASSVSAEERVDAANVEKALDLGAIQVVDGDDTVSIVLEDVAAYHGHSCPGSMVGFRAVQLAVHLLWGDTVPQRKDIVIHSRGSMYGVLDVFALVTQGPLPPKADAISQPSPVLKTMPFSRASFVFTIIRRSTGRAVDLRVLPTIYPDEFFVLRGRMKRDLITPAERKRLKQFQQKLIHTISRAKDSELFEPPVQYRVLMFGA